MKNKIYEFIGIIIFWIGLIGLIIFFNRKALIASLNILLPIGFMYIGFLIVSKHEQEK